MLNNPVSMLHRYCSSLACVALILPAIAQANPVTNSKNVSSPVQAVASTPASPDPATPLLELPATSASAPAPLPTPVTPPVSAIPNTHTLPAAPSSPPPSEDVHTAPLPEPVQKEAYKPKTITSPLQPDQPFLAEPVVMEENFSIMFSRKDMDTLIIPSLALYDKAISTAQQAAHTGTAQDDLTGLLASLKNQGEVKEVIKPLPNLYLGSIVYYTPSDWSIWVNGRKLPSRLNKPENEFFVKEISRTSIVLVWKPQRLTEMQKAWTDKTTPPHVAPKNVLLDEPAKTVTLTMRPNQTFVSLEMSIEEGLIKAKEPATAEGTSPPNATPSLPEELKTQPAHPTMRPPFSRTK